MSSEVSKKHENTTTYKSLPRDIFRPHLLKNQPIPSSTELCQRRSTLVRQIVSVCNEKKKYKECLSTLSEESEFSKVQKKQYEEMIEKLHERHQEFRADLKEVEVMYSKVFNERYGGKKINHVRTKVEDPPSNGSSEYGD